VSSSPEAPDRFERTAGRMAAHQDSRAGELADKVRTFVAPRGDEHALDVGTGAGALALALAPLVLDVVGVDRVPALLELARERAAGADNVEFVQGDATALPFPDFTFDLAGTLRTLHHVHRPELVVAELTRATRLGGRVLVVDQIAPVDPLEAFELDRFERARDPGHERLLPDLDMRHLFEANRLVLIRDRQELEQRDLDCYLDLAGCEGDSKEQVRGLAPHGPEAVTATVAWYLLERR